MSNVLVPLDDRPCNYLFPQRLAALGGFGLNCPPRESLGNARQSAHLGKLTQWVEQQLSDTQQLFLSLDTWVYGGLIFSRKSNASLADLQKRLALLQNYRQQFPVLHLHGFATVMRLSNSNDDTEEQPYWAQYGMQIHRLSWLEHYLENHPNDTLQREYELLTQQIPLTSLQHYRQLRERNFSLLIELLELTKAGLFDTLLLGYDDAAEYGFNVKERQKLQAYINDHQLQARVKLYPGADELGCVLLARVLEPTPLPVQICYSFPEHAEQVTLYEGIPLNETLALQAEAAGITFSEQAESILWLHNPCGPQHDQFLERELPAACSQAEYQKITSDIDTRSQHQTVMLADLYFANGGDQGLLRSLESADLLFRLAGYSAWNTVGNSLGLALAWLKLGRLASEHPRQLQFLVERLADDGWYQGFLRQQLCQHYTDPVTLNSCLSGIHFLNERFKQWQFQHPNLQTLQVNSLRFPWKRFFEIELDVCLKMRNGEPASNLRCSHSEG